MTIQEIIKSAEERIDSFRSQKRYKEADEERNWWLLVGFEVKSTKNGTKITWTSKK